MKSLRTKRAKQLVVCDCGCGAEVARGHLRIIRIGKQEGHIVRAVKTYFVSPECEETFKMELELTNKLAAFTQANAGTGLFGRILRARDLMKMQHAIHVRRRGFDEAKKIATRSALVFATPHWVGKLLAKCWKPKSSAS